MKQNSVRYVHVLMLDGNDFRVLWWEFDGFRDELGSDKKKL